MTAYYNEFDPFAAAWLRELIADGLIADGIVDDRSILEVTPNDLAGFTQCHFFAGIGGWSLALRLAGWPDSRPVWTGSCPCQPFSAAGNQKGTDDERHLWPVWSKLIRECRPATVFGEQVGGAVKHGWLDAVFDDLEASDYACGSVVLPACSVGAYHIRQRLWFVADSDQQRRNLEYALLRAKDGGQREARLLEITGGGSTNGLGDAKGQGSQGYRQPGDIYLREQNGPYSGRLNIDAGVDGGELRRPGSDNALWRDHHWIAGRDGKWRPFEPSILPLVDGLQQCLERLRTIEFNARQEVENYGNACKADASEVMRMVRKSVQSSPHWEPQPTGMREQLYEKEVLLNFLLCIEAARNGATDKSGFEKASDEVRRRVLRGVRNYGMPGSASHQRRPDGQRSEQSTDALHALSLILARLASAHREEARSANAAASRVGILRGAGNAIVPQVAAEVIGAYMEARA